MLSGALKTFKNSSKDNDLSIEMSWLDKKLQHDFRQLTKIVSHFQKGYKIPSSRINWAWLFDSIKFGASNLIILEIHHRFSEQGAFGHFRQNNFPKRITFHRLSENGSSKKEIQKSPSKCQIQQYFLHFLTIFFTNTLKVAKCTFLDLG